MMDKHLHIIPYTKEHGQFILSCQMNHKVLEADKRYMDNAKSLEQDNLAFTGMVKSKPIFAAGMKMVWGRVAEGWVIATSDMWNHPLSVARAIKKDFARVARQHNIQRVQTAIRKDFKEGQRFAEWLGLENEGLMKNFGFDGTDQYRYARIF
nr:putative acetyltransferase [uncultured Mediterranean phage uvMED]